MDALSPNRPEQQSAWQSPLTIRIAILAGVFALGLQSSLLFINRGLFILALPLMIPAYIACFLNPGLGRRIFITLAVLCFGSCLYVAGNDHHFFHDYCVPPSAEVRQNLYAIQLGLERYAVDHAGQYPTTVEEVIRQGYLPDWPGNPYFPRDRSVTMLPLPVDNAPFTGNFMYLPHLETVSGLQVCTGYELRGYGEHLREDIPPDEDAVYSLNSDN